MKGGQFGKIGENMVAFELSKRGWIVFLPPYDERIDILAMKFICSTCNSLWNTTHNLFCANSQCENHQEIAKTRIKKSKKCTKCNCTFSRQSVPSQSSICPTCNTNSLEEIALCNICESEIDVKQRNCTTVGCQSTNYRIVFRSIQVKSTHFVDNGQNLGFNFKYQDLLDDDRHFFIVYLRDIKNYDEKHHFWVMNKNDFISIKNIDTVSFKIYQNDRGHYNPDDLKNFHYDSSMTLRINHKLETSTDPHRISIYRILLKKYDTFLKLDE
ncbi:MAG: hypothetical protein KJ799_05910 [Bacteroidetes bacterium]|nr:hypothetical protein [Bacteroidota bacterium]MBU2506243.1 hypothetical protein [Bacteroidota bacterium]